MRTVPPVVLCVADPSPKYDVGLDTDSESSLTIDFPCNQDSLSNSGIMNNIQRYFSGLKSEQEADLIQLLHHFPSFFSDSPALCNYIQHEIKMIASCQVPSEQTP